METNEIRSKGRGEGRGGNDGPVLICGGCARDSSLLENPENARTGNAINPRTANAAAEILPLGRPRLPLLNQRMKEREREREREMERNGKTVMYAGFRGNCLFTHRVVAAVTYRSRFF